MRRNIVTKPDLDATLSGALDRGVSRLLSHQTPDGYWWYTLEANESIGAEYIFLEHCLGIRTAGTWERLSARMLSEQHEDGSWPLAYGCPGDLNATLECYVALRMTGHAPESAPLLRARQFIVRNGGLEQARVFTQIHFGLLGLVPWTRPPAMPVEIMLLPSWAPFSIYSFSSWARACIVPILVVMARHPVYPLHLPHLVAELVADPAAADATREPRGDIWREFFHWVDRMLKLTQPVVKRLPTKEMALDRAIEWVRTHLARTEDIFPALAFGALALRAMGLPVTDPSITKALRALQRFQHTYAGPLPALPCPDPQLDPDERWRYERSRIVSDAPQLHQQCCISPGWDTPWALCALRAAGVTPRHPAIAKACTWLLQQQVVGCHGDWHKKNPDGIPGGWSFEFENDYFPDIDDTLQIILALEGQRDAESAVERALRWCLSMQNDDGGFAAFDKNNSLALVNKIPFADHGACLDPSTPDITGRMLLLLARRGYTGRDRVVARALTYLKKTQEADGSWFGRWGVNYLYGTWAVLSGFAALSHPTQSREVTRALHWLRAAQQDDGGFGESVASYPENGYVAAPSAPSQTAWGLMGLLAAGAAASDAAVRAAQFLLERQQPDGGWDERAFTGTGFPGHFYLRYHGYRHFFPVLALAKYRAAISLA
ncbi:MAG: squalene--hopene cyclase [Deltaproteobacteria bacterium]|nr:squalene--hopene cyclase [Deltaproteobacteria bacterium]